MRVIKILFIAIIVIMAGFAAYYIGYTRGDSSGYDEGYNNGAIAGVGTGYEFRDPTYSEMKQLLREDDTDKHKYIEGSYTCTNYAADLNNNALDAGYKAAYAYIEYPDGNGHAIAAFQTVDKGLIFVEPQFDKEVQVVVGSSYSVLNGFEAADHDDTVVRYVLVW
jgi:hypothetical protein